MKKCLVTLTIGDDFKSFWKKYFEHRLDEYATRHGYDIVAIDDYIVAPGSDFAGLTWVFGIAIFCTSIGLTVIAAREASAR